jgi:hypothetical protein
VDVAFVVQPEPWVEQWASKLVEHPEFVELKAGWMLHELPWPNEADGSVDQKAGWVRGRTVWLAERGASVEQRWGWLVDRAWCAELPWPCLGEGVGFLV